MQKNRNEEEQVTWHIEQSVMQTKNYTVREESPKEKEELRWHKKFKQAKNVK